MRSEALPKFKKQFLKAFRGKVSELAMHKVGSRVVEACYLALDTDEKKWMVEELLEDEDKLSQNFFGRFALRKCRVQTFKTGGAQAWADQVESSEGVRDMFGDLMNADGGDFFGGGEPSKASKKDKKKKKKRGDEEESDAEIDALLSDVKKERNAGKSKAAPIENEDDEAEDKKPKRKKGTRTAEEPQEALPEFITEALEGLSNKGKKKKKRKKEEDPEEEEGDGSDDEPPQKVKKAKKDKKNKKRKFEA